MIQQNLFNDLPYMPAPSIADRYQHGAEWHAGAWQCRNHHGYFQSREGGVGPWCFQVVWFSNDDVSCTVYVLDAKGELVGQDGVPIDDQNRITIRDRKYGDRFWDH